MGQIITPDEIGVWTPVLTFATPGNLSVVYAANSQVGRYRRRGKSWLLTFDIQTSTFTHTSGESGNLQITGQPVVSDSLTGLIQYGTGQFGGITKVGYTQIVPRCNAGAQLLQFIASGSAVAGSFVGTGDCPTGGTMELRGQIEILSS